jgi:hypothetical protein
MSLLDTRLKTEEKRTTFGSITRIYRHGHTIIDPSTGARVEDTLKQREIRQSMRNELAARKIIFALRDRCVRPCMHIPSSKELAEAF